jgi:flavin reductase (DIM6/NTAB) family NADH-FMN oxidoreductase RutF
MFSAVTNRAGEKKDTVRNIEATREFVVNLVPYALAEQMNACASLLPYGESEFEAFGIESVAGTKVRALRVAQAPVAFECVLDRIVPVGEGPGSASVVLGRIVAAYVADAVIGTDGDIDPAKLDTIGRLGGNEYVTTRDRFQIQRPDRK